MWLIVAAIEILAISSFVRADGADSVCKPGVVLPVWTPQQDLDHIETVVRGTAYFLLMLYLFVGVSIVSDKFMGAIEVITSKQTEVKIKHPNGHTDIVIVHVWNATVANLSLMALGSSAPEILLSIIEICGKLARGDFEGGGGELGPGTIVGSAAFNLFVIVAICIYVIPDGEIRTIKHLKVFFVTAIWSVFAYIWLLIILNVISVGVVEIWEAAVTFVCFPLTVLTAYITDTKSCKARNKSFNLNKRGLIVETEGSKTDLNDGLKTFAEENEDEETREFEQTRRDYIKILREFRKKFPEKDPQEIEDLVQGEMIARTPKSRAYYRMKATRHFTSSYKKYSSHHKPRTSFLEYSLGQLPKPSLDEGDNLTRIFFNPPHYTVMESIGVIDATVTRTGGDMNLTAMVDYKTEDGTAAANSDYVPAFGSLTFGPGEFHKTIPIRIINDDLYEEDEHFYVRLERPRFKDVRSSFPMNPKATVKVVNPFLATVMILDDDHHGIFNIEEHIETVESAGEVEVKVKRWCGHRGTVQLRCTSIEGTAKPGKDFEALNKTLIFEDGQDEQTIKVRILEEDSYEKDVLFYVLISHPVLLDSKGNPIPPPSRRKSQMTKEELITYEGFPRIGPVSRAQIRVRESKEFKSTVDKLITRVNARLLEQTSSWKEQFIEAVTVGVDDDEDDSGGEEVNTEPRIPTMGQYIVHFLTIFWKVIFAFVPPPDIWGGYLAFFVSILVIGVLTAVIGDLAAHFGCTVGLKDSVTAISFVALGTSIPDTFASKVAAIQDEYADASIGNVTGSNAVNVFLGIGIAWTIAAIVYHFRECPPTDINQDCKKFKVPPGSLAFSVTLFCTCAVIAFILILLRRLRIFGGGELGGPKRYKYSTAFLFVILWMFYVLMSSLEAYGVVHGF